MLYRLTAAMTEPELFNAQVNSMACVGNGTAQFSPDSRYFAYLNFNDNYRYDAAPVARLLIHDAETGEILANIENATGYQMQDNGASIVSLYFDSRNDAVEAAVQIWDGESLREISTIFADQNNRCSFQTASITALPDMRQAVLLGFRCARGPIRDTQWQLHIVDPATRSATLAASGSTPGSYFPFTRTNQIFAGPDGRSVFFTVPDGLTNRSAGLLQVDLTSFAVNTFVERSVLTSSVTARPFVSGGHALRSSRDGRWLALVSVDPSGNTTLHAIDLSAPELLPIVLSAGGRGDTVSELLFAQDSTRLYYVAGGTDGGNNSLWMLDLITGSETRLKRGRYEQGTIAPDGSSLTLINHEFINDNDIPYQTLVRYDIDNDAQAILFVGANIVEGKVTDPRFAYPLAWLRQGE